LSGVTKRRRSSDNDMRAAKFSSMTRPCVEQVRPGGVRRPIPRRAAPAVERLPLLSLDVLAGTMFVASLAACWIAVAVTTTAPIVAARELLTRAVRIQGK